MTINNEIQTRTVHTRWTKWWWRDVWQIKGVFVIGLKTENLLSPFRLPPSPFLSFPLSRYCTKWLTAVDAKYIWNERQAQSVIVYLSHRRRANRVNKCSAIWHNLSYIEWKYASSEAKYISVFWLFDTAAIVASYRRRFLTGHSSDLLDVLSIDSIDGVEAVCFGIVTDAGPSP